MFKFRDFPAPARAPTMKEVAARVVATAAAGLATGYAYLRANWPRLNVPNHHNHSPAAEAVTVAAQVGACRVRFPGSVSAQIYYPTSCTPADCLPSYDYYRPNVVSAQQKAVRQSRVALDFLGISTAASGALTATKGVRGNPPPDIAVSTRDGDMNTKLPVILFSHGLFGHCDIHCVIGRQLALRGFIVVIMEHEGGAASYCVTEAGEQIVYNRPPDLSADEKAGGYSTLHRLIREFRGPILRHRENEIARVVTCLRERRAYPLRGDTGLPFHGLNGGDDYDGADKIAASAHCQQLLSSIDVNRMHIAGHSFGGATAIMAAQSSLSALRDDPPFKSCLLFDPWCECLPEVLLPKGWAICPRLRFAAAHGAAAKGSNFSIKSSDYSQTRPRARARASRLCLGHCTTGSRTFPSGGPGCC